MGWVETKLGHLYLPLTDYQRKLPQIACHPAKKPAQDLLKKGKGNTWGSASSCLTPGWVGLGFSSSPQQSCT
jgi:hypothetical protein